MKDQAARQAGSLRGRQKIAQAIQQFVNLHERRLAFSILLQRRQTVHCERAESEGASLAVRVERIVRGTIQARLRYEDWLVRNCVTL